MTDRGMIFSAPMVRALLNGQKTQTRRLAYNMRKLPMRRPGAGASKISDSPFAKVLPGDRFYVREGLGWDKGGTDRFFYRADQADVVGEIPDDYLISSTHAPAIHMPRWASRITLVIDWVRRETLQRIDNIDAEAEGVDRIDQNFWRNYADYEPNFNLVSARESYSTLWDSLHGPGNQWKDDPIVIALGFKVIKGNIDAL